MALGHLLQVRKYPGGGVRPVLVCLDGMSEELQQIRIDGTVPVDRNPGLSGVSNDLSTGGAGL